VSDLAAAQYEHHARREARVADGAVAALRPAPAAIRGIVISPDVRSGLGRNRISPITRGGANNA